MYSWSSRTFRCMFYSHATDGAQDLCKCLTPGTFSVLSAFVEVSSTEGLKTLHKIISLGCTFRPCAPESENIPIGLTWACTHSHICVWAARIVKWAPKEAHSSICMDSSDASLPPFILEAKMKNIYTGIHKWNDSFMSYNFKLVWYAQMSLKTCGWCWMIKAYC